MTMGKGGVGKTLAASAIAVMIAKKGFEVHLTTTDPAAHVQDFINQLKDLPESLTVDSIDPKVETQQYIDKIMSQKGQKLDDDRKAVVAGGFEISVYGGSCSLSCIFKSY